MYKLFELYTQYAFFRSGKRRLPADSLKALDKGYDRVLKSCRRHKEKAASALFRARPHFSRGVDADSEPPCCHRRTFSNFPTRATINILLAIVSVYYRRRCSACIRKDDEHLSQSSRDAVQLRNVVYSDATPWKNSEIFAFTVHIGQT